MKSFIQRLLIPFSFILPLLLFSQGTLQSIVPNEGIQGQTHQIVIKGVNTQFNAGSISVDLGPGIFMFDDGGVGCVRAGTSIAGAFKR